MCRPGYGFSRNLLTGGHIGPPLRGVGRCSEPTEIGAKRCLSLRGGTEPAPYGSNRAGRCVQDGGVRLGCGFRQPNSETEFGVSVMVTPPYGSNAGGAQRRADVGIGPYGWLQRVAATSWAAL